MQIFTILPLGVFSLKETMSIGAGVYHNLKNIVKENGEDVTHASDMMKDASESSEMANYDLDFKILEDANKFIMLACLV
ncbi:Eno1 [Lemmus lemmus]